MGKWAGCGAVLSESLCKRLTSALHLPGSCGQQFSKAYRKKVPSETWKSIFPEIQVSLSRRASPKLACFRYALESRTHLHGLVKLGSLFQPGFQEAIPAPQQGPQAKALPLGAFNTQSLVQRLSGGGGQKTPQAYTLARAHLQGWYGPRRLSGMLLAASRLEPYDL